MKFDFCIKHGNGSAPRFARGKLNAAILHAHIPTSMGYEEAVAADADGQRHVILFADRETGHCEIEHVLLVFGMEHDHAAVEQIGHFDVVRLNGQRSVDDAAGKHGNDRKTMARPGGNAFEAA
jgi:hypothetical protein